MTQWRDERDQVQARIVLDSISPAGIRLTTYEVTIWRALLAELNTHRVFSRNSESSRAVPFERRVERALMQTAGPYEWRYEQRGMQGGGLLDPADQQEAERLWDAAAQEMAYFATEIANLGVHKSIVNRLLEPFLWHTVVITATEFEGWDHQRNHWMAQPGIHAAAAAMIEAREASEPTLINYHPNGWHLPYIRPEDRDQALALGTTEGYHEIPMGEMLKRASAARAARVSFTPFPTPDEPAPKADLRKDLALYQRLADRTENPEDPVHWSPLEHVATPCEPCEHRLMKHPADKTYAKVTEPNGRVFWLHEHPGNLRGWLQHRHELDVWPYATKES